MAKPELSTTAYALLGLLVFDRENPEGMTGYELKQRADFTLRYYWVSPAMSQIYTELRKLADAGLAETAPSDGPARYRVTGLGEEQLQIWLFHGEVGFPILKHPVALRLLMGRLSTPERLGTMLEAHLDDLAARRADLQGVRDMLGDEHQVRYAAMVADWGLAYYDSEASIVTGLRERLDGMD
ncbi:PadR family transcriptional regulator [Agreia bicolorata]|uniref:PadR family transcriptional regulator n=1 Tax=Agreia bicolorata TaxID=110935 RepID=UPI000695B974|nr:PadR family transcriptional regulator [Agreia bicolorata]